MNFNEKEVGKLIQRATELHEQSAGDSEHKLSLSEIESIAGELGVPSRFLQEAVLELKTGRLENDSFSLSGAPFTVDQTRLAEGKLSEQEWNKILLELQRYSGKTGTTGNVGRARHWVHQVGEGEEGFSFEKLKVTVEPTDDGQTSIHIRQDYQGAVVMYVMAFGITSLLTLIIAHSLPDISKIAELLYAGLGGVISLAGVRALIAASAKRYKEKLSTLADRLHHIIDRSDSVVLEVDKSSEAIEIPSLDVYAQDEVDHGTASRSKNKGTLGG